MLKHLILIDVFSKWGLSAFGQTDLDQRVHRNQDTRDLGKMSFGILQAFLKRLKQLNIISDLPETSNILMQFIAHESDFEAVEHKIVEFERPPMIDIPEYLERKKQFGEKINSPVKTE